MIGYSVVDEVYAKLEAGDADAALTAIEPLAQAPGASHLELTAYSDVLRVLGRREEALQVKRRAALENPTSAVAEHNLASTLGDLDRWEEAEIACRRALALGGDAPETWQVLGRALMNTNRLAEAEDALREALKRNPTLSDAHRDLAQLIWMRTGDREASIDLLRQAAERYPLSHMLPINLALALQFGGAPDEAYEAITRATERFGRPSIDLELTASNIAIARDQGARALEHAKHALMIDPGSVTAGICACEALLQLGEAEQAARMGLKLYAAAPNNQALVARLTTAWRMIGDPRYEQLCDYDALVRPSFIDTPDGWKDLGSYLADLAAALKRLHAFETHPFGQSLRGGSQTSRDLTTSEEPAVRAFFSAIDGPIRRYMAELGEGRDVVRRRMTGDYSVVGAWSVMLRPHGFHADHTHPMGWLSSACYIELPESLGMDEREGWIKFGEPGMATRPPLPPEHFVRPEPGLLVLFPSYMWHGTIPFSGTTNRLTIAFDVIPRQDS